MSVVDECQNNMVVTTMVLGSSFFGSFDLGSAHLVFLISSWSKLPRLCCCSFFFW